jgi:hypothetical protein
MTAFDVPAFKQKGAAPAAARPHHPGRILPGRAGRGVNDLRAGDFSRFRASLNGGQAIGNATANDVPVTWDSIDIDTDDTQKNNQAVLAFAGEYLVAFTLQFASDPTGIRRAQIEVSHDSGATWANTYFRDQRNANGGGHFDILHACGLQLFTRSDSLRVTVFQNSGAPLNLTDGLFAVQFASPS